MTIELSTYQLKHVAALLNKASIGYVPVVGYTALTNGDCLLALLTIPVFLSRQTLLAWTMCRVLAGFVVWLDWRDKRQRRHPIDSRQRPSVHDLAAPRRAGRLS